MTIMVRIVEQTLGFIWILISRLYIYIHVLLSNGVNETDVTNLLFVIEC